MRKSFNIIVAATLLFAWMAVGCGTATENKADDAALNACLDSINGVLPVALDEFGTLDSVYFDGGGNTAVFNLVVDEAGAKFQAASGEAVFKKTILDELKNSPEMLSLYQAIARHEVDVRTVLMAPSGRNYGQVELTGEEINGITASAPKQQAPATSDSLAMKRDSLDVLVDSINALCPDSINSRTELTKVQVENNYLVYNYVCEETKGLTVDKMKSEIAGRKEQTESKLRKPTPEMKHLIELCVDNGLGIKHRYVGKSTKQTQDFAFSAVDLSKMSNHPLPEGYEAIKERIKTPKKQVIIGEKGPTEGIY